jgi:hypothetical protein
MILRHLFDDFKPSFVGYCNPMPIGKCILLLNFFMKAIGKIAAIFFVFMVLAFIPPKQKIVGKWIIFEPDGTNSGEFVNIYRDGTYDVTLPGGQIGERGYYKLDHSTFSIKNAVARACGEDYWGTYQLTWYGRDSISFVVLEDSCTARREDIVGGNPGLRRFKSK